MKMQYRYFLLYKPYGVLSQFTQEVPGQRTLAELKPLLPNDVYPVGRLDKDSEGLLLLTNDPQLNQRLLNPRFGHRRVYLAQVEGIPTAEALQKLSQGVDISTEQGMYRTLPAEVSLLSAPPTLPDRHPPVRFRAQIPTAWMTLALTEGKNRQVRRMCAAVGFPVLRLIRTRIEGLELGHLQPGEVREIKRNLIEEKIFRQRG